jgi:hypothetical protein
MQLAQMATSYWVSQSLFVAAKLGLADLLASGPKTAAELSHGVDEHALYRLLRALASVGIFAEDNGGRFHLTPLADPLRSDHPESKRAMILMAGDEQYRAWGNLLFSVQTGQTGFEHEFGQPIFDYLAANPDKAKTFDDAMVSIHGRETPAMLEAYDFSEIDTLADLGGGNGSVLRAVLAQYPAMSGIVFDLPNVADRARAAIAAAGFADRCQAIGGSFFETAPAGADAYFLRHVLHDWNDEQCLTILGHIHRAAPPHARLLVVESIVEPGNGPSFAKLLDLTMLVIPGGQERTESQWRSLLARGGFELVRIVPTSADVSVLEAVKAVAKK